MNSAYCFFTVAKQGGDLDEPKGYKRSLEKRKNAFSRRKLIS